jgi:hypothetical protein
VDSEEEEEEAAAVDLTDEVEPHTDQPQSEAEEDNNSLNHHPTSDDDDDGDYVDEGVLGEAEPVSHGPVRRLHFQSLSDASTEGGDDDDVLLQSLRDPNGVAGAAGVGDNVADGGAGDSLAAGGVGRVAEAVVAVAAIAAVARTISQIGRDALLGKYDMIESVPALDAIGEVHNVEGDGNCGFYCLLLALAVLRARWNSVTFTYTKDPAGDEENSK